ncbi:DUF948 domain-containing protein [Spongiactinospora sp. TRM90649]|uniref:DUF948 domain-containing protein n=1 Tax=Spongiactinospora sp. TRM90649 TaxID=3031114 RepID=UPI0023F6FB8D|nr:DUF948 domain-containing protein [Spongiactinospora sp. TRM90649]MDF5751984.1 DUF948 domain-containing protein [Spongiactinospora sp. TRM90649]
MLTAGQVAGLIVAMFWAILVCFLAMVLVKVARLLTETTKMVAELGERVVPLLDDVNVTVGEANRQLAALDVIALDVKQVSGHLARLSAIASTLVTGPLIKVSAFGHGVRRAASARRDPHRRPRTAGRRR